jgi:hypothetical protein
MPLLRVSPEQSSCGKDSAEPGRLRERAAHVYGLTRGSLSRAVEDALIAWFRSGSPLVQQETPVRYFAFRAGKSLMEAPSLKDLAKGLKKAGIDPRDIEIRSSAQTPGVEKLGLRLSHRAA